MTRHLLARYFDISPNYPNAPLLTPAASRPCGLPSPRGTQRTDAPFSETPGPLTGLGASDRQQSNQAEAPSISTAHNGEH